MSRVGSEFVPWEGKGEEIENGEGRRTPHCGNPACSAALPTMELNVSCVNWAETRVLSAVRKMRERMMASAVEHGVSVSI